MAKREIPLCNIKSGEFLSWIATTQAAFKIRMKLYDNKKVYFDETQQSVEIEPPLAQGSAYYEGKDLTLLVDVPEAKEENLNTVLNCITMVTPKGVEIGHSFTCCGEDYTDHDYNDFCLNVTSWKSKG